MKNQYGIEPCPFCGTSVVSCEYDGHYIWVECGNSNCKASMMAVRMDNGDADEAKKMWNTRPIEAKLRAEIADLTTQCTECHEPADCTVKAELRERDKEIERLNEAWQIEHTERVKLEERVKMRDSKIEVLQNDIECLRMGL